MKKILSYLNEIEFSNSKGLTPIDFEHRAMFIGVVAEVILSKEFFSRNEDLKTFIQSVFKKEMLEYVYKSRTLLLSRVIRLIELAEKDQLIKYTDEFYFYIENINLEKNKNDLSIESDIESKSYISNKRVKKRANLDTIENWRKVIDRNHE